MVTMRSILRSSLGAALLAAPAVCSAQRTLTVNIGTPFSVAVVATGVINFLALSIGAICTMLFVIGAFFVVASAGNGNRIEQGKGLMLGSLLGLGVTLGAYAILRTLFFLIYA